jgi:hypothetical protein
MDAGSSGAFLCNIVLTSLDVDYLFISIAPDRYASRFDGDSIRRGEIAPSGAGSSEIDHPSRSPDFAAFRHKLD